MSVSRGMDRQICPEGHIFASRGFPRIPYTHDEFFFLHALMRRSLIFMLFT